MSLLFLWQHNGKITFRSQCQIFRKLRIQGRMQIFQKMSQNALNRVLMPAQECRGQMLQIPLKIMDLGALCVELRPIYCSKRILVPMSYIWVWEQNVF